MERSRVILALVSLMLGARSATLDAQIVPVAAGPSQVTVESRELGERRPVLVYLPESHAHTQDRYPVLVVVDGDGPGAAQAIAVVNRLSDLQRGAIPELIVVAIPNRARSRDLVPPFGAGAARGTDGVPPLLESHADRFLAFIEHELLPDIDRRYRTNGVRFLHGSSYGGLFGIFAFITRPELFRGIVANSPSLWVDKQVWVDSLRVSLSRRPATPQWLYLSAAEFDHGLITTPLPAAQAALVAAAPASLRWRIEQLAGRDHQSANYAALERGLAFIFADFDIPYPQLSQMSADDVRAAYRALSGRYGWTIRAPMWAFNRQLLIKDVAGRPAPELLGVCRALTEDYPWHPYGYDAQTWFLGESKQETERAVALEGEAVRVAMASGYWTGEYEATLARLRMRLRSP